MTRPMGEAEQRLQDYLHQHIPLSAKMGVVVTSARVDGIELRAPLAPNINHESTAFGGSLAAIALLAGWGLIHVRTGGPGAGNRIVIQRFEVDYQRPVRGGFTARSLSPPSSEWDRFTMTLQRRGRARIRLDVEITGDDGVSGVCRGWFVVLPESD